jgi:fructokinase
MIRIGIDLGGTKTSTIAINDSGAVIFQRRISTPSNYRGTLQAVSALVSEIETEFKDQANIGLGHPGSTNPANGLMRNANSTWLNGKPFLHDLEFCLQRSVRMANDADCFALSEATDGAGKNAHIVFGVILGTGVGGGIVIDKKLLSGASKIAGEWGHNPLPWPDKSESFGPKCWCGNSECIETWLSGPALSSHHFQSHRQELDAKTIFQKAEAGDKQAKSSIDLYANRLARSLASVINVIDPDTIILGGGLSNAKGLPTAVTSLLPKFVFSDVINTKIIKNQHGDDSGVRGAAWLWPSNTP